MEKNCQAAVHLFKKVAESGNNVVKIKRAHALLIASIPNLKAKILVRTTVNSALWYCTPWRLKWASNELKKTLPGCTKKY